MTAIQQTVDLHQAASQASALMDAITESIGAQRSALIGTLDQNHPNSNFYLADELYHRLSRANSYTRTVIRQTLARLESFGVEGSQPPPPLVLTPYGLLERVTGFVSYRDPAVSQILVADTPTAVINNRSVIDESQKPADVTTYYDGNRFRASLGEALLYRITLSLTPNDSVNTANELKVWFDYGAPGVRLFEQNISLGDGYNISHPITYVLPIYAGPTFSAEGGRLMVQANGGAVLTNVSYLITRLHRST